MVRKAIILALILAVVWPVTPANILSKPSLKGSSKTEQAGSFRKIPMTFNSGKYQLTGKLVVPNEITSELPVIVFCVGSGASSTMASYESFIDSLFFQSLPMDKLAFFYFDKRGVGASEGKWYNTSFEERAADVKAAADHLKTLPFIDKQRIAVAGHSQGGWITQLCMAEYPDTFIAGLSLAGPAFDVKQQIANDYASTLICKDQVPEDEANRRARKKVKLSLFLASLFPLKEEWKQLKVIRSFDPEQVLSSVKKPLWLLFGENDRLVSPELSGQALKKTFPQGLPSHIKKVTIAGASHSFKVAEFCHEGSSRYLPYSDAAKTEILAWTETYLL